MHDAQVAILDSIPRSAIDELEEILREKLPDIDLQVARTAPDSCEAIEDASAVVTRRLSDELFDAATNLQWVQAISAGVDSYDLDRLQAEDIALTNASGIHGEPIAEQVLCYLLAFERNVLQGINQQHRGVWEKYGGGELRGKTLGIVGLGAIGTRVAELGDALGMTIVGTKRDPSTAPDVVAEAYGSDGLYDVLARSDYVVLACPLTDETRDLIGRAELSAMKRDAVLVNIARGGVVDEEGLEWAIQQGVIGGAALDVFEVEPLPQDSPLWNLSNVIITPHMAGSTPYYWERCAELFVENYRFFAEGDLNGMKNRIV